VLTKESVHVETDLIVGCDGAYSAVRASLLKDKPIDFAQNYISSYYLELQIPAAPNGDYLIPPNHLHIWPRGNFMMIALPNQDHTFTCTIFMPLEMFEAIKNEEDLMRFFEENFNDSIELIGK
jgi:2-polyprenyl-6-methoxyphenol hydroxylase-like FAD-dependent oxidoreductase